MVQRVRDIHGRFVHPDEKAAQEAAIAAKFAWKAPVVLREWGDGWRMVRFTDYEDLKRFGDIQGHCAGAHWKWCGEQQIWHLLTLLDPRGEPHGYLHMKDSQWIKQPHPDDDAAEKRADGVAIGRYNSPFYYNPGNLDGYYFKSSAYGVGYNEEEYYKNYRSDYTGSYNVSGHKTDILSVGPFSAKQGEKVIQWLNEVRIEDEGPVAAAQVA